MEDFTFIEGQPLLVSLGATRREATWLGNPKSLIN
jgi:hypothetical protein